MSALGSSGMEMSKAHGTVAVAVDDESTGVAVVFDAPAPAFRTKPLDSLLENPRLLCRCSIFTFFVLGVGVLLLYGGLFGVFAPRVNFWCRRWNVESATQPGCPQDRWASRVPPRCAAAEAGSGIRNCTRIVLIGDSLVMQPNAEFDFLFHLKDKLSRRLPGLAVDLVEAGVGMDHIADIERRLQQDCLDYQPDAVILLWDSDVSEVEQEQCEAGSVTRPYVDALTATLGAIFKVTHRIAVLGPTVLGELVPGHNLSPWRKDACLEHYCALNRDAVAQLGSDQAVYINARRAFIQREAAFASGAGYAFPSGLLTIDGEHPSRLGSDVLMDLMVDVVWRWYAPSS